MRVRERHGARVTDHERARSMGRGAAWHAGPDQNSSGRCSRPLPTTLMRSGLPGRQSVRSDTPPIEKYTIRLLLRSATARGRQLGRCSCYDRKGAFTQGLVCLGLIHFTKTIFASNSKKELQTHIQQLQKKKKKLESLEHPRSTKYLELIQKKKWVGAVLDRAIKEPIHH